MDCQRALTGGLTVDAGALGALRKGRSLLPAGVLAVEGQFERDLIAIHNQDGEVIGHGLLLIRQVMPIIIWHAPKLRLLPVLTDEIIHADNLVMVDPSSSVKC